MIFCSSIPHLFSDVTERETNEIYRKKGEAKKREKKEWRRDYIKDINKREDKYRQTDSESRKREKQKLK